MPWGAPACCLVCLGFFARVRADVLQNTWAAVPVYRLYFSLAIRHSPWMQDKVPHWLFSGELWETFCLGFFSECVDERGGRVLGQHRRVPCAHMVVSGSRGPVGTESNVCRGKEWLWDYQVKSIMSFLQAALRFFSEKMYKNILLLQMFCISLEEPEMGKWCLFIICVSI